VFVVVGNIFFLLSLQTLLCLFSLLFVKISPKFVGGLNAPPGTRERKTEREREREEGRKESIAYVDAALLFCLLSLFLLLLS
jgi:hypothetical protein